ncbi:MAG: flavodoxin family protein [Oscillospiraceae bacterium]
MKYSIVYSSQTGNTAMLAQHLKERLPESSVYCGAPDGCSQKSDLLFAGFWTNKGGSDRLASDFLKALHGKQIFLFGTAGFGGSEEYYRQILAGVKANPDSSNTVVGSYMCQGKMPLSVRQRYEDMQSEYPEKTQKLMENFDRALSHPDQADLDHFVQAAMNCIQKQGENHV